MISEGENSVEDSQIEPFEWLTNFSALEALLDPQWLFHRRGQRHGGQWDDKRVLHVGCGSSTLGQTLMLKYPQYSYVINVDNDIEILRQMKKRWENLRGKNTDQRQIGELLHSHMDFKTGFKISDPELDTFVEGMKFDLVVDKSTLDCLLCTDDGASGLICSVYRNLKPGGIYFLVSFHDVNFIQPLLKNCPGIDWEVERYVAERKVDAPNVVKQDESKLLRIALDDSEDKISGETHSSKKVDKVADQDFAQSNSAAGHQDNRRFPAPLLPPILASSAWSSGTFIPGQNYGKTVNIFICRRATSVVPSDCIKREDVSRHLHRCNDEYYQKSNPMLTHVRKEDIKRMFLERMSSESAPFQSSEDASSPLRTLPLEICYEILFTETEKEVLGYDNFLEDWRAYSLSFHLATKNVNDGMTYDTAISFLEEMQ